MDNVLEMRNISKSFAGVKALEDVDFCAKRGKVNVLMGENGAGKSTLMRVLAGAHTCDSGKIYIDGKEVKISSPDTATHNHVAMIYQELNLVSEMTVEQNLFLGREISRGGFLEKKKLLQKAREIMDTYRVSLDPKAIVGDLSVANQQMLEIVKALSLDAKILIMDEPTSSLTLPEVKRLFEIIHQLNAEGITIIYISHRMEEIFEIGDYITIMRDGKYIGEWNLKEISREQIIAAMVGREISQIFPKHPVEIGNVILKIDKLSKKGMFNDISFELRRGEILGVSGLVGAGRTEMAMTIFGAIKPDFGDIYLNGEKVIIKNPQAAIEHKIAYLPEDRKKLGVDLESKISTNIAIANLDRIAPHGFLKKKRETELCNEMVKKLHVKTASVQQPVGTLSGGNQQKVALAKWLARDIDVLILDEPTRGVDIGAKEEIHKLIVDLAEQHVAIILISSELPEVLGMADRIMVMHEGKQTAILNAQEATQEKIMSYSVNQA